MLSGSCFIPQPFKYIIDLLMYFSGETEKRKRRTQNSSPANSPIAFQTLPSRINVLKLGARAKGALGHDQQIVTMIRYVYLTNCPPANYPSAPPAPQLVQEVTFSE